jgi:hypothetical protein
VDHEGEVEQSHSLVRGSLSLACKVLTSFFTPNYFKIDNYRLSLPTINLFPVTKTPEEQAGKWTCLSLSLGLWRIILLAHNSVGNACHVKATTG